MKEYVTRHDGSPISAYAEACQVLDVYLREKAKGNGSFTQVMDGLSWGVKKAALGVPVGLADMVIGGVRTSISALIEDVREQPVRAILSPQWTIMKAGGKGLAHAAIAVGKGMLDAVRAVGGEAMKLYRSGGKMTPFEYSESVATVAATAALLYLTAAGLVKGGAGAAGAAKRVVRRTAQAIGEGIESRGLTTAEGPLSSFPPWAQQRGAPIVSRALAKTLTEEAEATTGGEGAASAASKQAVVLARSLRKMRRYDEARRVLSDALAKDPESPFIMTALGNVELECGNLAAAVEWVQKTLERDPTNRAALTSFAKIELARGDKAAAVQRLQELLGVDPTNRVALTMLGQIEILDGDLNAATARFRKVLESRPSDPVALTMLGQVELLRGNTDAAAAMFHEVLKGHPSDPVAMTMLGQVELARGKCEAARGWFQKALDRNPEDSIARTMLGQVELIRGNFRAAIAFFQQVISLRFDKPTLLLWREAARRSPDASVVNQFETTVAALEKIATDPGEKAFLNTISRQKNGLAACLSDDEIRVLMIRQSAARYGGGNVFDGRHFTPVDRKAANELSPPRDPFVEARSDQLR